MNPYAETPIPEPGGDENASPGANAEADNQPTEAKPPESSGSEREWRIRRDEKGQYSIAVAQPEGEAESGEMADTDVGPAPESPAGEGEQSLGDGLNEAGVVRAWVADIKAHPATQDENAQMEGGFQSQGGGQHVS